MEELFKNLLYLPPPFNMIVLIMFFIAVGSTIQVISKHLTGYADNRAAERFKLELIQSGLSVEEAQQWASMKVKGKAVPETDKIFDELNLHTS